VKEEEGEGTELAGGMMKLEFSQPPCRRKS